MLVRGAGREPQHVPTVGDFGEHTPGQLVAQLVIPVQADDFHMAMTRSALEQMRGHTKVACRLM